jgi:hypothetical protein
MVLDVLIVGAIIVVQVGLVVVARYWVRSCDKRDEDKSRALRGGV